MQKNKPVYILVLVICSILISQQVAAMGRRQSGGKAVIVKMGITGQKISGEWREALWSRMKEDRLDSFSHIKRALSKEEIAWQRLISVKVTAWNSFRDSLGVLFQSIVLPDTIYVMLGFLGDDDGFTFGKQTVCLDVTALYRAYGKADLPENDSRIDRIFAHEYTHLLHKQWASKVNYKPVTFRDEILWECLYEGIGMYRSLNAKWIPVKDSLPSITVSTLNELYPIFTERIITIEKNPVLSDIEKERLHTNLSRGPVNKKWGAFPVAIWLLLEARPGERNLDKWIHKGPDAVIELAKKYLPRELNKLFSEVF